MKQRKQWSAWKFSLVRAEKGTEALYGYYAHELGLSSNFMMGVYNEHKELLKDLEDWQLLEFMEGLADAYHEKLTLTT